MPDFNTRAGDTDVTIYVRLRDSTTGLAKTGLVFNSAGAVCSYVLPRAARAAITLATQTVTGAHSDGGFVEVDATNSKGLYRLDLPDAAVASGAFSLISIEFDGIIEETIHLPLANTVTLAAVTHTGATIPTVTDVSNLHASAATAAALAAAQTDLDTLTDARGEPGQGAPPVSASSNLKLDYLYKSWRNRSTQTATTYSLYADDGTTVDQKATVSDDTTTADKGEVGTGP